MKFNKSILLTILFMIFISITIIFIAKYITLPSSCAIKNNDDALTKDGFYFDTYVSITLYNPPKNGHNILDKCMELCQKYEKIFSRTDKDSQLSILNEHISLDIDKQYTISDDLYQCIEDTLVYSAPFGGKYSILAGRLCDLWNYNNNTVPSKEDILYTKDITSSFTANLSNNNLINITLKSDSSISGDKLSSSDIPVIDLGSSAKGYIADKLYNYLKEQGVCHGLIDLGGNIIVIGNKPDNTLYKIGIKKPFSHTNEVSAICKIADTAIVTSGIYQRYFKKDEHIYHHIIDCTTGYPSNNDILSVTIITKNALQADCYSTGCLLLGKDYALAFINSIKEVECVIIDNNNNIHLSDGLTYENNFIVMK